MATEAEQRVIDAARNVVQATLAHVRDRAAFDMGQVNPDIRQRLALAETFHSTALDSARAESALLDAVEALDAQVPAALDVAAIEARAAVATRAAREHRYCRDCGAVDPPEAPHNGLAFHDGCPRPNWLTGGVDAVGTTHGIVAHATVLELLADNAALLAALRAERAQHAADVAAASRSTRESCAATLRARAECLRRYAYEATAKADATEYTHDASEVDACAAIVASVALAAPTGGGE